jgi:hypothetical protein
MSIPNPPSLATTKCYVVDNDDWDEVLQYGHCHHHAADKNYQEYDYYYNYLHDGHQEQATKPSFRRTT